MSDSADGVPLYVVDASVAVKWVVRDEPDAHLADAVLRDFRDGQTRLLAPAHLRYEVPSAVRNAIRANRLPIIQGGTAVATFLAWGVSTVDDDALIALGFEHAVRFDCSLYDGLYLALAELVESPFVHAYRRLRNALGGRFPLALWLADYVPLSP